MLPKPGYTFPVPKIGRPSASVKPEGMRLMLRYTGSRFPRVKRYVAVTARSDDNSRLTETLALAEYSVARSGSTVVMSCVIAGRPWMLVGSTFGNDGANGCCARR